MPLHKVAEGVRAPGEVLFEELGIRQLCLNPEALRIARRQIRFAPE
jgi:hypothetical protein